jgi:hypothetical protein
VRVRDAPANDRAGRVLPAWSGTFEWLDRRCIRCEHGCRRVERPCLGCLPPNLEPVLAHGFTGPVLDSPAGLRALESSFGAVASVSIDRAGCSGIRFSRKKSVRLVRASDGRRKARYSTHRRILACFTTRPETSADSDCSSTSIPAIRDLDVALINDLVWSRARIHVSHFQPLQPRDAYCTGGGHEEIVNINFE